jgi:hypothetical protein
LLLGLVVALQSEYANPTCIVEYVIWVGICQPHLKLKVFYLGWRSPAPLKVQNLCYLGWRVPIPLKVEPLLYGLVVTSST